MVQYHMKYNNPSRGLFQRPIKRYQKMQSYYYCYHYYYYYYYYYNYYYYYYHYYYYYSDAHTTIIHHLSSAVCGEDSKHSHLSQGSAHAPKVQQRWRPQVEAVGRT